METGGSNVQFAVNPDTEEILVIEMNPRVSRSSALASKATGFPIAKIAARLAVGYRLDEIDNDITGVTPACFEPTIDYVVVKWPRFAFEKFPGADGGLTGPRALRQSPDTSAAKVASAQAACGSACGGCSTRSAARRLTIPNSWAAPPIPPTPPRSRTYSRKNPVVAWLRRQSAGADAPGRAVSRLSAVGR